MILTRTLGAAVIFLLVLFASTTSRTLADSDLCRFGNLEFRGKSCQAILSTPPSEGLQLVVDYIKIGHSRLSCELHRSLVEKRRSISLAEFDPDQTVDAALELSHVYSSTFARSAEQALSVAQIELGWANCVADLPRSYLLVSTSRVEFVENISACEPVKKLLLLRLVDICSGSLQVIGLNGIRRFAELPHVTPLARAEQHVKIPYGELVPAGVVFRNRHTDIDRRGLVETPRSAADAILVAAPLFGGE